MYVLSCNCPSITLPDEKEPSVYAWYTFPTFSVPNVQQEDEVCDAQKFLSSLKKVSL